MINELYTAKKGTPHVVRVVDVVREMTKELELFLEEYETLTEANKKQPEIKTNIKMRVTPEQSVKVQEICIKNGIGWAEKSKSNGKYAIQYTDKPYLYISQAITWGVNQANYEQTEYVEVDPELFIRTNGTCEENKLCSSEELKTIKDVLQDIEAPQEEQANQVRKYNIGSSDYAKRKIQPWDIWLEYELNPWDADIVKRVLRNKQGQPRTEEYQKIIHICEERIRQIANT